MLLGLRSHNLDRFQRCGSALGVYDFRVMHVGMGQCRSGSPVDELPKERHDGSELRA